MSRLFSIRPALRFRGRKFKGLRGYAGKPFHPPLTDFPVAAYILALGFDLISAASGADSSVGRDFFISATHVLAAGLIVSVPTALTGFWDWLKSTKPHTQAWRTANWHMAVMVTVTLLAVADLALRLMAWEDGYAHGAPLVLSVLVGGLVAWGAVYGGALVYEYGFNVETSGDHPVWHVSESDV